MNHARGRLVNVEAPKVRDEAGEDLAHIVGRGAPYARRQTASGGSPNRPATWIHQQSRHATRRVIREPANRIGAIRILNLTSLVPGLATDEFPHPDERFA